MFSGSFAGDNLSAQSIRFQKAEIPTVKMLIITQLSVYVNQHYTCYSNRQLDPGSVQALMVLLTDLHMILSLRDYKKESNEKNHMEEFKILQKEYIAEIEKMMSQKSIDDTAKIKASLKANAVLDKIFMLALVYVERFGLLEPEDSAYEAEDIDTDIETEEYQELKSALKDGKKIEDIINAK